MSGRSLVLYQGIKIFQKRDILTEVDFGTRDEVSCRRDIDGFLGKAWGLLFMMTYGNDG